MTPLNIYDYMSRRVKKVVNGVTNGYDYDGWAMIRENKGAKTNLYVWGLDLSGTLRGAGGVGGLLAVTTDEGTYLPTFDANGNVSEYIASSDGSLVCRFRYDPYGNLTEQSGVRLNMFPLRFSTKYWDGEVGMYYYGYRFYSPEMGRWVSRDPLGELFSAQVFDIRPFNEMHFVLNAPINGYDVLGLFVGGGIECRGGEFVPIVFEGIRDPDVKKCAMEHEQQHADDYNKWYPDYCKRPGMDGYGPPGENYDRLNWKRRLVQSECNSYTVSSDCLDNVDECKAKYPDDVKANRKKHKELKDCYCAEASKWFPDPNACDRFK